MFFIILTLGSYIALMVRNPNLVVNTNGGYKMTVTGLRSFAKMNDLRITAIANGSTQSFFKSHRTPVFMKVYEKMKKTGFVNNTMQGVEMVKKKGVAFVMETSSLNYLVNRDCELIQLADEFAERHYAFVMQKNDVLRHLIDQALLELTEVGEINRLQWVWWKVKSPTRCRGTKIGPIPGDLDKTDGFSKTSGLGLQAFGGPLIFLLIGLVVSALVCVAEILVFKHYDKVMPAVHDQILSSNFQNMLNAGHKGSTFKHYALN
jgi:hypothetical protein